MKVSRSNITAVLLIVTQLFFGVLIESVHSDERGALFHSRESFAQHQCGANEIHIPLDKVPCCQACMYSTQRAALQTWTCEYDILTRIACTDVPSHSEPLLKADLIHTGKRGPPLPTV